MILIYDNAAATLEKCRSEVVVPAGHDPATP